jgi:hypothetical protein
MRLAGVVLVRDRWIRGRYHPASDHAVTQHGLGGAGADDVDAMAQNCFGTGCFMRPHSF